MKENFTSGIDEGRQDKLGEACFLLYPDWTFRDRRIKRAQHIDNTGNITAKLVEPNFFCPMPEPRALKHAERIQIRFYMSIIK